MRRILMTLTISGLIFSLLLGSAFMGRQPVAAATITVNSLSDALEDGTNCTLRKALAGGGGHCATGTGNDLIVFADGLTGTINVASTLTVSGRTVHIDGDNRITLNGLNGGYHGIVLNSTDNTLSGLTFINFGGATVAAVYVYKDNNQIANCQITGNRLGIYVYSDIHNTVIENNVISGNVSHGIQLTGNNHGTQILNNTIGANAAGDAASPNLQGIAIVNALDTVIDGNLISGNNSYGINLSGTMNTHILNNTIGANRVGNAALPNGRHGIEIGNSQGTVIEANLISGHTNTNFGYGINVATSEDTQIVNNTVGTNLAGTVELPNRLGISIAASQDTVIQENLVSGNIGHGIFLWNHVTSTQVLTNTIGVNRAGDAVIANGLEGIYATNSVTLTIQANLISGNRYGIMLQALDTATVVGNYIGTDSTGDVGLSNRQDGITLLDSEDVIIGGPDVATQNVIAYNTRAGVWIDHSHHNRVENNLILSNGRTFTVDDGHSGVYIKDGSSYNVVISNTINANNIGVRITGDVTKNWTPPMHNQVLDNVISANIGDGILNKHTHRNSGPYVTGLDGDNLIQENTITNNGRMGIFNEGGSPAILTNAIQSNQEWGIGNFVYFGLDAAPATAADDLLSMPYISGNQIQGNDGGIFSQDTTPLNKPTLLVDNPFQVNQGEAYILQTWYGAVEVIRETTSISTGMIVRVKGVDGTPHQVGATYSSDGAGEGVWGPSDIVYNDVELWFEVKEYEINGVGALVVYTPQLVQGEGAYIGQRDYAFNGILEASEATGDTNLPTCRVTGILADSAHTLCRYQLAQLDMQEHADPDDDDIPSIIEIGECELGDENCVCIPIDDDWFCAIDTDGDGVPDYLDPDDEGDGIPSIIEIGECELGDDNCVCVPDGDGWFCAIDTDGDGVPDYLDPDDEGDGVPSIIEIGECEPGDDNCVCVNVGTPEEFCAVDTDGDGVPDYLDPDDDGDGVPSIIEIGECEEGEPNCICEPIGETGEVFCAVDTDGDGTPDYLDDDDDGDGIPSIIEIGECEEGEPNCICAPVGETGEVFCAVDTDGDGIPDYLDPDDDGDGIPSADEAIICTPNPDDPDNDQCYCNESGCYQDSDNDGIPDYLDPDDDGDGIPSADEAIICTPNPDDPDNDQCYCNESGCYQDTDNDGIPDYLDEDDDGDGVPTEVEAGTCEPGTDNCVCFGPGETAPCYVDTDDDGVPDFLDDDDDGDGVPTVVEADLCEQGSANCVCLGPGETAPCYVDTDGDGVPDFLDDDDDGDGIPTIDEIGSCTEPGSNCVCVPIGDTGDTFCAVDTNGNGIPDYLDPIRRIYLPLVMRAYPPEA